ncbi:hypothetical protein BS17DRAFT_822460 [Gyrodon lividus]|nr:hypothetical protein BS17DRAFT_822460 [Gyrodon lividus]
MYGPLKDAMTGESVFNNKAWDMTKNILKHIFKGYYSDPPDVALYFAVRKDSNGLTLYHCCHGTNDCLATHAMNMALEYVVSHNMQVSTQNRMGHRYIGHFNVPLKNEITALQQCTQNTLAQSADIGYGNWVNGKDYAQTKETFGVLPFDEMTQAQNGMLPYSSTFTKENDIHHQFLAYVELSPHFTSPAKPDFAALACQMNEHTDGQQFFYKHPEHLRTYYITWKDIANEKTSTALSSDALEQICLLLKSQGPSQPNSKWQLNQLLANHCLKCSALHYCYGDQA